MPTTASKLLADPAQVALVRDLIVYARKVGAVHATYSFGNGLGQPMAPVEHTWDLGPERVAFDDGYLIYRRHGRRILSVRAVTGARQVGQLLAAIGVLPASFAMAAPLPVRPDRKCRYCGATSGLTMVPGDVLELAPMQWHCWDGCRDSAR